MQKLPALFLFCILSLGVSPASQSSPLPTHSQNPVSDSILTLFPRSEKNIQAAVDAMPADKFAFRPTPAQMTFGHLVTHIIESNNLLCAKAAALDPPKSPEVKETDPKDKLSAALKASFEFCGEAVQNMNDSRLGDDIELFGGKTMPRAMAVLSLASGWADHYGAAAMYLRLNGILPPTAAPKK
jgi:uncharacterized damage-inducible protein DinB